VVSRAAGQLDLCWVGTDHLIHAMSSSAPGTWTSPAQVGDPAVHAHPMASVCAVSRAPDRIDVLFIGRRDGDTAWRLYHTPWTAAAGWSGQAVLAGGAGTSLEPLSPIAACARTADNVDAFAVAATGALLISTYDRASDSWLPFAPVGGQPVVQGQPLRVAAVEGAVFRGGAEVGVIVTGRDQRVWATRYDAAAGGYTQLAPAGQPLD